MKLAGMTSVTPSSPTSIFGSRMMESAKGIRSPAQVRTSALSTIEQLQQLPEGATLDDVFDALCASEQEGEW